MLKDFAWNTFEITGNIESYIFYKEIEDKAKGINELANMNGEAEADVSGVS